jgi:hypothetical protein
MVRWLYILGICMLLAAGGVLGPWWSGRGRVDREVAEFLNRPGAIERFSARGGESTVRSIEDSPLVVQAKSLSSCLDPPKRPEKPTLAASAVSSMPIAPPVRPVAPSVRFRLCGTSYYPNEPKRSMALISELGLPEGEQQWVKEGTQVGHFVIHEIRKGMIVYRDGDQLREMAVEHGASMPSIVRDTRSGSREVSAAVDDAGIVAPAPAGPNSIGIAGGDRERLKAQETIGGTHASLHIILRALARGSCVEKGEPAVDCGGHVGKIC